MRNSLLTELTVERYVDKSLVPSTVIKLASVRAEPNREKLLMVASPPPELCLLAIHREIPDPKSSDPHLRAMQIAVGPEDLACLDGKAWVDCSEADDEFSYAQVRLTLISEPERIVGNLPKEVVQKVSDSR